MGMSDADAGYHVATESIPYKTPKMDYEGRRAVRVVVLGGSGRVDVLVRERKGTRERWGLERHSDGRDVLPEDDRMALVDNLAAGLRTLGWHRSQPDWVEPL